MTISFYSNSSGLKLYAIRSGHLNLDLRKIEEEILADRKPLEPQFQSGDWPGQEDDGEWNVEAGHAA